MDSISVSKLDREMLVWFDPGERLGPPFLCKICSASVARNRKRENDILMFVVVPINGGRKIEGCMYKRSDVVKIHTDNIPIIKYRFVSTS